MFLLVESKVLAATPIGRKPKMSDESTLQDRTARKDSLSFKDHSDVPEGGFEALFPRLGGYQLVHLSGDERSRINVRFGKQTLDLYSV